MNTTTTYSEAEVSMAVNEAANQIQQYAADNGFDYDVTCDLTNMMVNTALTFLVKPPEDRNLETMVLACYELTEAGDDEDTWQDVVNRRLP